MVRLSLASAVFLLASAAAEAQTTARLQAESCGAITSGAMDRAFASQQEHAARGQPNGYAALDAFGHVPASSPRCGDAAGVACADGPGGFAVNLSQPDTGRFWQAQGAAVDRFNDRLLIGAATANDGTYAGHQDWLIATVPNTTNIGQTVTLSTIGALAVIGASRASDWPDKSDLTYAYPMGVAGFTLLDNANPLTTTYAVYGEARRSASAAGIAQANEFDIINAASGPQAASISTI